MEPGQPVSPVQLQQIIAARHKAMVPACVIDIVNELLLNTWNPNLGSCEINVSNFEERFKRLLINQSTIPESWWLFPEVFKPIGWFISKNYLDDYPPWYSFSTKPEKPLKRL